MYLHSMTVLFGNLAFIDIYLLKEPCCCNNKMAKNKQKLIVIHDYVHVHIACCKLANV